MAAKRRREHPDERVARLAEGDAPLGWWLEIRGAAADAAIDRDVARSCETKDRYASEAAARATAVMNKMADVLYAYECRYCRQWHLTRRPTSGK